MRNRDRFIGTLDPDPPDQSGVGRVGVQDMGIETFVEGDAPSEVLEMILERAVNLSTIVNTGNRPIKVTTSNNGRTI